MAPVPNELKNCSNGSFTRQRNSCRCEAIESTRRGSSFEKIALKTAFPKRGSELAAATGRLYSDENPDILLKV